MYTVPLAPLPSEEDDVAVLDAMVAAGATNISGPTFSIDDPSPMLVQARGAALKSAKAQADYYAQAAEVLDHADDLKWKSLGSH